MSGNDDLRARLNALGDSAVGANISSSGYITSVIRDSSRVPTHAHVPTHVPTHVPITVGTPYGPAVLGYSGTPVYNYNGTPQIMAMSSEEELELQRQRTLRAERDIEEQQMCDALEESRRIQAERDALERATALSVADANASRTRVTDVNEISSANIVIFSTEAHHRQRHGRFTYAVLNALGVVNECGLEYNDFGDGDNPEFEAVQCVTAEDIDGLEEGLQMSQNSIVIAEGGDCQRVIDMIGHIDTRSLKLSLILIGGAIDRTIDTSVSFSRSIRSVILTGSGHCTRSMRFADLRAINCDAYVYWNMRDTRYESLLNKNSCGRTINRLYELPYLAELVRSAGLTAFSGSSFRSLSMKFAMDRYIADSP